MNLRQFDSLPYEILGSDDMKIEFFKIRMTLDLFLCQKLILYEKPLKMQKYMGQYPKLGEQFSHPGV